jgi:hypothetical protein
MAKAGQAQKRWPEKEKAAEQLPHAKQNLSMSLFIPFESLGKLCSFSSVAVPTAGYLQPLASALILPSTHGKPQVSPFLGIILTWDLCGLNAFRCFR